MNKPKHLDIYYANLYNNYTGSIQGGKRPVLVIQNNVGNTHSTTVTVVPFTSRNKSKHMPTHVTIEPSINNGLRAESTLLAEQITTISQCQLINRVGSLEIGYMPEVRNALMVQMAI